MKVLDFCFGILYTILTVEQHTTNEERDNMTRTTTEQTTGRTNRGNVEFAVPAGTDVIIDTIRNGQVAARTRHMITANDEFGSHWVYGPETAFAETA